MNLISGLHNWASSCSFWPSGPCAPVSLMSKPQEAVMKAWPYAAVACFLKPLPRDGAVAVELPSNRGNQKAQYSFLYISCKSGLLWKVALTVLPLPTLLLNQSTWGNMFHTQQRITQETWSPSIQTFLTVLLLSYLSVSCIVLEVLVKVLGSLPWQIGEGVWQSGEGVSWGWQNMLVVELRWRCCFPGPWFLPWPVINFSVYEYLLCLKTISLQMVMNVLGCSLFSLVNLSAFHWEHFCALCTLSLGRGAHIYVSH